MTFEEQIIQTMIQRLKEKFSNFDITKDITFHSRWNTEVILKDIQLYHWAPDYVFGTKYYKEDNTFISSNSAFSIDEIIGCDVIDKNNEETLGKD